VGKPNVKGRGRRMKGLPLARRSVPRGLLVILALVLFGTAALWLQGGKGRGAVSRDAAIARGPVSHLTLQVDGMT